MFIRRCTNYVGLRPRRVPSREDLSVQPKRRPIVISIAAFVFASLTMLILGVIILAKLGRVPAIVELPQRYLPGSAMPNDTICTMPIQLRFSCEGDFQGKKFQVFYNIDSETISDTVMMTSEYTIG